MKLWLPILIIGLAFQVSAQNVFIHNSHFNNLRYERFANQTFAQQTIKPFTTFSSGISRDTLENIIEKKGRRTWWGRKLKEENFIEVRKKDFFLTIDPLADLQLGKEDIVGDVWQNTRAIEFTGQVGKNLHFYTNFYENQAAYPQYIADFVNTYDVSPGQGRVKVLGPNSFDFAMASAMISFNIGDQFNVQFGNGKNFIGSGYRSLFLSDNAFNYPHLKLSTKSKNKKWYYQTIFSSLIDLQRLPATTSSEAQFYRKLGSFHYLTYSPNEKWNVGLFEGIIYRRQTATGTLPFAYNFLNPVIGFNSAVNGFNKAGTTNIVGFSANYAPTKSILFYHQTALSGRTGIAVGFQLGAKLFEPFDIDNLNLGIESNLLGFVFNNEGNLSYSHYNQNLAYSLLQEPSELMASVNYSVKDIFVLFRYSSNMPGEILRFFNYAYFESGYILNRITGLKISGFYQINKLGNNPFNSNPRWFGIKFSTSLNQRYFDF